MSTVDNANDVDNDDDVNNNRRQTKGDCIDKLRHSLSNESKIG